MLTHPSFFAQMRMQGVWMAERSSSSILVWIWVPYVCVGGIGWVIWRPLAEQLWEHAVEELMTGPAGQNPCRPQLLVNMPAEKTEFRERSATIWLPCSSTFHALTRSYIHNSWGFRTPACDIMRPSGVVPFLYEGKHWKFFFFGTLLFLCAFVLRLSHVCIGLWLLMELFCGKLIRDETKICRQHIFGSLQ